jgi:hypothetical protein
VIAQRVLAVLAAVLLVGAVAVATLGPPNVPLGAALYMVDRDMLDTLQSAMQAHLAQWMWDDLAMPLLVRPAWLLPASMGLICVGVSLSLGSRSGSQRPHRRRF